MNQTKRIINSSLLVATIAKPKNLVFLSIDLDTGCVSIEVSQSVRKIEPAPIGHYVHFCTMSKAIRLKRKFDKAPYLVERFLNS